MTTKDDLRAEIEVDAAPATVWSVLMDFGAYPQWNPFVDARAFSMRPKVTVNEPGSAFGWLGRLGIPYVFDGAHRFTLESLEGGRRTRFVQSEAFRGILLPLVRRRILPRTLLGFEAMNRALAARAEAMQAADA